MRPMQKQSKREASWTPGGQKVEDKSFPQHQFQLEKKVNSVELRKTNKTNLGWSGNISTN